MRAPVVVCVLFVGIFVSTGRAEVLPTPGSPWQVSVGGQVGIPVGWVKVGERGTPGTRLRLRSDLGIDTSEAFDADVRYRLDSLSDLRLSFDSFFLDGSSTLSRDVFFNGATLAAGSRVETRTGFPNFLRLGIDYERHLAGFGRGGELSWSGGLTYVLLTFRLKGTLAASSKGGETKEDFVTQELPVPIFGLRAEYPLADRLSGILSVTGGYLPRVDSLRNEGGDVKLNQAHTDVNLGVGYEISQSLRAELGYHYRYFFQLEKSGEDDNVILLSDNALRVSLDYRF